MSFKQFLSQADSLPLLLLSAILLVFLVPTLQAQTIWIEIDATPTPPLTGFNVPLGGTIQLSAVVHNSTDQSVTWQIVSGGGTLSSTTSNPVTYTAPMSMPSVSQVRIAASRASDNTNHSSVLVSLLTPQWAEVGTTARSTIPSNFVGLSNEWGDLTTAGDDVSYQNLIKNLVNNDTAAPFLLRVGGGSTDKTGEPSLSEIQPLIDLHNAVPNVHYTLGINMGGLKTPSPVAVDQASFYMSNMSGMLDALELGNEPEGYRISGYRCQAYELDWRPTPTSGDTCYGQASYYYLYDFDLWSSTIKNALPPSQQAVLHFMGPASGNQQSMEDSHYWSYHIYDGGYAKPFEDAESSKISIYSQHFYANNGNGPSTSADNFLISDNAFQFSDLSSKTTQDIRCILPANTSTVHGYSTASKPQTYRLGEMNSIAGGANALSTKFASALWAIDTFFEFASAGADGVNIHTTNQYNTDGSGNVVAGKLAVNYSPFSYTVTSVKPWTHKLGSVNPLYYGMYFFHQATPAGAKLLPVQYPSNLTINAYGCNHIVSNYKVWSTVDTLGNIYVAVLNKDTSFSGNVSVVLPGYGAAKAYPLTDPNGYNGGITLSSDQSTGTTGITFAGQTFDGSTNGTILGAVATETITPDSNGVYSVPVDQKTMAVLLVVPHN